MLEELVELHYAHEEQSSFMQLPCFLQPHCPSDCHREENETELWNQDSPSLAPQCPQLEIMDEIEAASRAQAAQRHEVYAFLSELHGGRFKRFATRYSRLLAVSAIRKRKNIRKETGKKKVMIR